MSRTVRDKFGDKGESVVQDNRVVRRGLTRCSRIPTKVIGGQAAAKRSNQHAGDVAHAATGRWWYLGYHRWEQTGFFYSSGRGNDNLADPTRRCCR